MLHVDRYGPEPSAALPPPLFVVHGLFGSARNWAALTRRFAERRPVRAVDLRNHGQSPWTDAHRYVDLAADLAQTIAAETAAPADILGHSMGGKAAMALALTAPERVARLVVADIAPVAYSHSQMPILRAMAGLDLTGLRRRAEADVRLAESLDDPGVRAFLLQSLDLGADPPRWRLNLDALERHMPDILGWPEDLGPPFPGPALFLAGAASDYIRAEHRPAIRALFPRARLARIPGAGHWLHADKPAETAAAVAAFLDAAGPAPAA